MFPCRSAWSIRAGLVSGGKLCSPRGLVRPELLVEGRLERLRVEALGADGEADQTFPQAQSIEDFGQVGVAVGAGEQVRPDPVAADVVREARRVLRARVALAIAPDGVSLLRHLRTDSGQVLVVGAVERAGEEQVHRRPVLLAARREALEVQLRNQHPAGQMRPGQPRQRARAAPSETLEYAA